MMDQRLDYRYWWLNLRCRSDGSINVEVVVGSQVCKDKTGYSVILLQPELNKWYEKKGILEPVQIYC